MTNPLATGRRLGSERGATLVHVAIASLTLMAMLAYAVDRGIVWISRGQAQNAADAGALAGAVSRAYEEKNDPPLSGGYAETSALTLANGNNVWGQPGSANVSWNCPNGVVGLCSRVDVYRNGEFGSATLPVIFSRILGITSQGVRATATAVVYSANSTDCLRPFAIPDKWVENTMSPEYYNHWNGNSELTPHDSYPNPGHGWTLPGDLGAYIQLKMDEKSDQIQESWFQLIQLPTSGGGYDNGGANIRENIRNCSGNATALDDYIPFEMGNKVGPVKQGIDDLIARDPDAEWDGTKITGSCAPGCAPYSPRIIPIAVYDPELMNHSMETGDWGYCPTSHHCIRIKQIISFFIDDASDGKNVYGWLVTMPGELLGGAPVPDKPNSFLQTIRLVR